MEFELKQSSWVENTQAKDAFLAAAENMPVGGSYIETIRSLEPEARRVGQVWLQSIIDEVAKLWPVKSS